MSNIKPIKVYGQGGPNPPKIAMLLKELSIPHEIEPIPFNELKNPDFIAINPNGRMPAIQDPNTNLTLWESGAIIEYIIERYDTDRKLSFEPGTSDAYFAKQWLFFQVSGQGPYYGQAVWFTKFHPEKIQGAIERYAKEINRVTGVLEGHLKKQKNGGGDGPWLVGNRFSFADMSFVPWQKFAAAMIAKDQFNPDDYPIVKDWVERMMKKGAIADAMDAAMKPAGA